MKISSNIEQYFDDEGRPLVNGRVSFYKHDSDTLADIFYIEGADYVQADNPVITSDDGRVPTVWFDAAVVDVKVEKCLPDGSYEQLDTFQIGFDYPKAANSTLAYGIEELKSTDPAVGVVQVIGYHTDSDAPARFYVWDANCTTAADGGVIVESDVGEEGRWVLIWDDEKLPSSVYGIVPGVNEANIAGFLGYPDVVGSYSIKTPPIPRFLSGNYTSSTTFSTTKTLYFDKGARFLTAEFECPRAVIPDAGSAYIADFTFTGENAVAHSGWFRTVEAWWHCGAHTMVFDETNHFAGNSLTTTAELEGRVFIGCTRVPTTYVNGSYLYIRKCAIQGRHLFAPSIDYLRFQQMDFTTDWFTVTNAAQYDFGTIANGNRIECKTLFSNTLEFDRISSPNVYYKARLANGDTEFDGRGATYSMFTVNDQFVTIANCHVPSMIDRKCQTWQNVTVDAGITFDAGGASNVTMDGCDFYLYGDLPVHIQGIALENCNVRGGGKWRTSNTRITVTNSNWAATCELSEAAKTSRALAQPLTFDHCNIGVGSNYIWTNNVVMTNCVSNAHVYNVPYLDGADFKMVGTYVGNHFVQGALIELRPKDMAAETEVYNVLCSFTFKDNRFEQDDSRGIVMPYYTNDFDNSKLFVNIYSPASVYVNNTGKCPDTAPSLHFSASALTQTIPWDGESDGMHYEPTSSAKRVWNTTPSREYSGGLVGTQYELGGDSWNPVNGQDARMHNGYLLHAASVGDFTDASNDQFAVVHCWRKIQGYDSDLHVAYFNM